MSGERIGPLFAALLGAPVNAHPCDSCDIATFRALCRRVARVARAPGLSRELTRRIRAMASRWQYTADDLAYAMEDAQARPDAWLACCEWDEQLHEKSRRAGMPWPPEWVQ